MRLFRERLIQDFGFIEQLVHGELATSDEEGDYVERKIEISGLIWNFKVWNKKVFPNLSVRKGSLMIIPYALHKTF